MKRDVRQKPTLILPKINLRRLLVVHRTIWQQALSANTSTLAYEYHYVICNHAICVINYSMDQLYELSEKCLQIHEDT